MHYFPVFLDLQGKNCLVVGAGQVGMRKIERLLQCSPSQVQVLDPGLGGEQEEALKEHPAVLIERRAFEPADLQNKFLVIASSSDEGLNAQISHLCEENGILCNIVDQPEYCSFIVPALFTQGKLSLAISTEGHSPALARSIRQKLPQYFGPEYALLLDLMSALRPLVLGLGRGAGENKHVFRNLVNEQVLDFIRQKDKANLAGKLKEYLPQELHHKIWRLLDELF